MCDPATVAIISAVSSGAAGAAALYGAVNQKKPAQAAIPAPTPPPAPAQTPDYNALKKKLLPGVGNPTALTGAGGIPDEKLLLGKATVLGA